MAHTGADGSRTIDVLCTRCSNVVRIRQEPDAHGREKALLRTELARLHGDLDRIGEEFEDFKTRSDLARTVDAGRFAVFAAKILEKGVDSMRTVEEMSEELDEIRRQAAAAVPGAECRAGDPEQAALIGGMEAKMSKLEAALRYYETPNSRRGMPSLYDKEAKKFDKGIAESCSRPMPEARRGPPMGHLGAPHSLKPEKTIDCPAPRSCPDCKAPIPADCVRPQPESKTFVTLDASGMAHAYQLRVGHAWCYRCQFWARSPDAPDVRGTCYSPAILAKLLILYSLAVTDRKASERLPALLGFTGCPSALPSARKVIAHVLEPFMKHLETLLTLEGRGHFDETTMRMFGKQGYLWLLTVACAAMVVARPSRGKKIFDEELAFARHLVGVVDGYKVYEIVLGEIQRCWRHIINNFKKAAVRSDDPRARSAYFEFCDLFGRISGMDTAPEPVRDAIVEKALAIAARLPEGHPARTEIENAGRNLVTFLKFKGMPPTNNPGESDIRRGPVAQRNVRYQLRTEEGARIFSVILSFILTCDKQGVPLDEAFIALAGGADPAIYSGRAGGPEPVGGGEEAGQKSRAGPDGAPRTRWLQAPQRRCRNAGGGALQQPGRARPGRAPPGLACGPKGPAGPAGPKGPAGPDLPPRAALAERASQNAVGGLCPRRTRSAVTLVKRAPQNAAGGDSARRPPGPARRPDRTRAPRAAAAESPEAAAPSKAPAAATHQAPLQPEAEAAQRPHSDWPVRAAPAPAQWAQRPGSSGHIIRLDKPPYQGTVIHNPSPTGV